MHWFCVHTKPLKEPLAVRYLAEMLGLETFFPRMRETKRVRRRRQEVISPLFPRYLFARFDLAASYRSVRYAPDVLNLVSFGGGPSIVPEALISDLRLWAGELLDFEVINPPLGPGDAVEIVDGPMQGMEAIVLHNMRDTERVAVLLSTLQYQPRLVIDRAFLERAS